MNRCLVGACQTDVTPAVVSFLRPELNRHAYGRNRDRAQADHLAGLTNVGSAWDHEPWVSNPEVDFGPSWGSSVCYRRRNLWLNFCPTEMT